MHGETVKLNFSHLKTVSRIYRRVKQFVLFGHVTP